MQSESSKEPGLRVAYLVNLYPKVSHSFIRREILALERRGVAVQRISIRGWADEVVDQEDQRERERTQYVLRGGALSLIGSLLSMLWSRPRRLFDALLVAFRMSRRADRPLLFHLVYLAEACTVCRWTEAAGVSHLHAHFGTNPAEVAMLVCALGGPSYSFTVHGPEEFDRPQALHLGDKIRRAAFVVAISSFGRSQLFRWVDHSQWSKVRIVHCGLEPGFHAMATTQPVKDVRRLVCVGRLCEQKGQLLLVDAARRLRDRGEVFELVLAGDGEMRHDIEEFVRHHAMQDMVTITGWITSAQVRTQLLDARAMVLPSFAEGLPVVIMEAMALGRPVISTYVAGIPELVRDDVDGWLVPAGDIDQLVGAMSRCLSADAESLQAMGSAARERVLERHDVDREAARLHAAFMEASHSVEARP